MESYRGLAVLATNRKGALDPAFLRRLRFVVNFPVPRRRAARRDLAASLPAPDADRGPGFVQARTAQSDAGATFATSLSIRLFSPPTRGEPGAHESPGTCRERRIRQNGEAPQRGRDGRLGMKAGLQTHPRATSIPSASPRPVRADFLRGKCACDSRPGPSGQCPECRSQPLALPHRPPHEAERPLTPPIVSDARRSFDRRCHAAARSSAPRFGHDFSRVRVQKVGQETDRTNNLTARTFAPDGGIRIDRSRNGHRDAYPELLPSS